MGRLALFIAIAVSTLLFAGGVDLAIADKVCASSNWDSWIKQYQPNVKYNAELANGAAKWSYTISTTGQLGHDPNFRLPPGGTVAGEIVGMGGSAAHIQTAFENSPSHYGALTKSGWTHYGYAVVNDSNGLMWVTVRFATIKSAPVPAPASAATPKPAPSKAAPRITAAPEPRRVVATKAAPERKPKPAVTPVVTSTPEESNEKVKSYRNFPRVDEQSPYTGPILRGFC